METIQLPGHEHPLIIPDYFDDEMCHICSKRLISYRHYAFSCEKCDFFFHYSCLLPFLQYINHPSHPDHPLTILEHKLQRPELFGGYNRCKCSLCRKPYTRYKIPHFECGRCYFYIDIFCVLKIPTVIFENKDNDPPLCHGQPMRLVEIKHDEEEDQVPVKCCICELPLVSNPAYTCTICHHVFHRSCTEPSSKIRHPFFHLPHHDLIFKLGSASIKCESCHKTCFNFIFQCSNVRCGFYICVECRVSTIRPTVIYQGHDHLLSLVELPQQIIRCNYPYGYCQQYPIVPEEHTHTERYVSYCQSCNFSLHLLCGPLPCVIKHNCHIHPLTFLDFMIEDDSGEYYCDACETLRDPRICVYYCAECKYVAHVNCVISEVVRVLQGDCRDVELRVVGQMNCRDAELRAVGQMNCRDAELRAVGQMNQKLKIKSNDKEEEKAETMTLSHLFPGLTIEEEEGDEGEKVILEAARKGDYYLQVWGYVWRSGERKKYFLRRKRNDWFKTTELSSEGGHQEQHQSGETSIQDLISSSYSHIKFEKLVRKLNSFNYDDMRWSRVTRDELNMKIVNVEGGYKITWNLAHVLKDLLGKFGDISGDKNRSSSHGLTDNILYFFLCRLVYKMSRVIIADVTEDVLEDWYSCSNFLKSLGFKVDFLNFHLEQIVRAYFGLQARKAGVEFRAKRDENILNLRGEIEELKAKLKRREEDLESNERQRSTERLRYTSDFETTIFMNQCLDEGSRLEWENCWLLK